MIRTGKWACLHEHTRSLPHRRGKLEQLIRELETTKNKEAIKVVNYYNILLRIVNFLSPSVRLMT